MIASWALAVNPFETLLRLQEGFSERSGQVPTLHRARYPTYVQGGWFSVFQYHFMPIEIKYVWEDLGLNPALTATAWTTRQFLVV